MTVVATITHPAAGSRPAFDVDQACQDVNSTPHRPSSTRTMDTVMGTQTALFRKLDDRPVADTNEAQGSLLIEVLPRVDSLSDGESRI